MSSIVHRNVQDVKVSGSTSATYIECKPISNCCVVWCGSKNKHQKDMWLMKFEIHIDLCRAWIYKCYYIMLEVVPFRIHVEGHREGPWLAKDCRLVCGYPQERGEGGTLHWKPN